MSDYNLFLEPDEDIETFKDTITDNVFINGELLKKGEKNLLVTCVFLKV